MPRQLVTDNLAIVLVVFDEKDADGIRFCALGWLGSLARNWEATAHGAGGRRGRLMSPPWASLLEGASARGTLFFPPLVSHRSQSSHIWYSTGAQYLFPLKPLHGAYGLTALTLRDPETDRSLTPNLFESLRTAVLATALQNTTPHCMFNLKYV